MAKEKEEVKVVTPTQDVDTTNVPPVDNVNETVTPPVEPPVEPSKDKEPKVKEKAKKEEVVAELTSPIPSSKVLIDYAFATNDKVQLIQEIEELEDAVKRIKLYLHMI